MPIAIPSAEDLSKAYCSIQLIRDRLPAALQAPYDVVLNDLAMRIVGKGEWDPAAAVLKERLTEIQTIFNRLAAPFLTTEKVGETFVVRFAQKPGQELSEAQLRAELELKLHPLGYETQSIAVGEVGNDCEIVIRIAA